MMCDGSAADTTSIHSPTRASGPLYDQTLARNTRPRAKPEVSNHTIANCPEPGDLGHAQRVVLGRVLGHWIARQNRWALTH
jgi:hypothetical protein